MSFIASLVPRSLAPRQLIANVIGRVWMLFSNILFLPIYLRILGAESFGVIALFMAVASLIVFLDMGLSPTLSRELNDQSRSKLERLNLLFSYEIIYAVLAGAVMLIAVFVPQQVFQLIVSARDFDRPEIRDSLRWIFISAAAQLWLNFYVSAFFGIERQITGNIITVSVSVIRSAMVILPLWLFRTPIAFLIWHLSVTVAYIFVARILLYRALALEGGQVLVFSRQLVLRSRNFTGSVFLISIAAAFNTQIDKLFIGRLTGVEALAPYSLAVTLAQLLVLGISPLTLLILPRLIRFVSGGNEDKATEIFQIAHRVVSVLVCSCTGVMVSFGPFLVQSWTGGRVNAEQVSTYLPALVLGYCFLALQVMPHNLAIAHKNMRGGLFIAASVFITVPAYWVSIRLLGSTGAAIVWLVLQAIIFPIYFCWVVRTHTSVKNGLQMLISTVFIPFSLSIAIGYGASQLVDGFSGVAKTFLVLVLAWLVAVISCFMLAVQPQHRRQIAIMMSR